METRKLQQTGGRNGSSYLVVLPKDWVLRQNLEKGDTVVVSEKEDGCLIIDPRMRESDESRKTEIQIQSNLRWGITSKYLLGFDEIRVVSDEPITNEQREELKQVIKRFVALEVTDEEDQMLLVQCLVDPSTIPVQKAMKRTNLIASRMLRDALLAYYEGNIELAKDVADRDEEVDRLFFLIVRELRSAIRYPSMADKMGIAPVEALDYRLVVQYIERIADLAVDIAGLTNQPVPKQLAKKIDSVSEIIKEMLVKSLSNLFTFDSDKVAWVMDAEKEMIVRIDEIRNYLVSKKPKISQIHTQILDILARIGESAKDIADLALPRD
ncbi:phosphate uptake regulator PhoU [Candidatus Thorarchaeota archaeon]|nr:MAG: phosphate uptake regulator PhoU [Candidatus Thorarchaeota archaeon]